MKKYKIYSKISLVLLLAMSLNLAMVPGLNAARLTSAKDTLTRTQISGTGSATAGYTQSTVAVTDGFNIVTGSNNIICLDTDGSLGVDTTCLNAGGNAGEVKVNLITNGGLISGNIYTGDQIATAIKTAIEAADTDADDTYTVTYDEATDLFTIRGDGGNTLNPAIGWALYAGADNAASTLGYTANDTAIRDANKTSDSAVAFRVVSASNNTFTIQVDGTNSGTITITANPYTGATLATQAQTQINADATLTAAGKSVTVAYASNKFKITSASTGSNSTIKVTEGATDFLKTVKLVGDFPVNGAPAGTAIAANHTIDFTTTTAVAAGEKVVVDFPTGFNLPTALNFEDVDMKIAGVDATLAATASGATWGVAVTTGDGGLITITSGTGTIGTTVAVQIEIGRNATFGVAGVEQITNPTTVGLYQILVKTTTAADVTIDDSYIGVYIVPDDSVVITATVDPVLSLSLYGGTYIDFGTLEPNAYQKLGGARNSYGYADLSNTSVDDVLDAETVTIRGVIYEFSDDGVIAVTSYAKVDIVDNENNYLTTTQAAANLYRAINNYDGSLVRASVYPTDTDRIYFMATQPGSAANAWTITETVTDTDFAISGATLANGFDGYNQKHSAVTYGAGTDVGNNATGTNIVISTNAAGGYVLTVQNTDSNGANDNYDGLTNGIVEIPQWSGSYGYGVLASSQSARYGDGTSAIIAASYQGDGTGDLPGTMSTTAATLASYSGTTAGDNIAVEYNIRILPDQAAGLYTDTVTYVLTSTF